MRREALTWFASLLAVALAASPARAQLAWDTPSLVGPHVPPGLSIFLVDPSPGDGLGALGTWRHDGRRYGIGYRAALAQDDDNDLAGFGGVDVSGALADAVAGADIQIGWWSGLGAGFGRDAVVSVPLGLVVGWHGRGGDSSFAPYVGGHVVLDVSSGQGDNLDLEGVADLGLDLTLVSGWVVRFGAAIGRRDALAVGLRVPGVGAGG